MSLPPLFSENKRVSETLGQLESRSLQGLASPLKHKFAEGRLMGMFLVYFVLCFKSHKPGKSLVFQLHFFFSCTEINGKENWIEREPRGVWQPAAKVGREMHEL